MLGPFPIYRVFVLPFFHDSLPFVTLSVLHEHHFHSHCTGAQYLKGRHAHPGHLTCTSVFITVVFQQMAVKYSAYYNFPTESLEEGKPFFFTQSCLKSWQKPYLMSSGFLKGVNLGMQFLSVRAGEVECCCNLNFLETVGTVV